MSNNFVRAFICIEFPDEVIKEVARIQELMGNKLFIGKFSELENLHLTLKFLGDIEEDKVLEVKKRLEKIEFNKFEAKIGEIGIFHSGRYFAPKIVWLKINSKEIWSLQKMIDEKLKGLFPCEEKFKSHMTVARLKYVKDKVGFEDYVSKIKVKEIKFNVNCFKIKSSELKSSGPIHREIESYNLK